MPSSRPPVRRAALVAAAAVVAASVASGQFPGRRFPGFAPDAVEGQPHDDKDVPAGVTVPDSPGAVERLTHAAEKEQQKQWKTAADFYREAVAQFGGRVVPAADRAAGTYRFTGVAAAVQERLAHWPPEGLAVYRNLYGPAAADRLAAAARGDRATLTSVFTDDFVTDAGKAAGLRLVDSYTEAGDFPAAAAVGDRLLDLHPLLGADRPTVLFRTALADHWAGDDAAAARRQGELRQSDAKAIGSVAGHDVVLADALAGLLAAPAPRPAIDPSQADTYPSFGGPGGRGDVSPSTARPGASLNTIALTPPDYAGVAAAQREAALRRDRAGGPTSGIMPVVDAGTLFFQDGRTVYAVDADTGLPVTAWLGTYPGEAGGRYHLPGPGRPRGEQLTVTVTPTDVLAVMGQRDRELFGGNLFNGGMVVPGVGGDAAGTSPVRLVCLDRATGVERWKATPADLPEAAGAARAAEYDGPVLTLPAAAGADPSDGDSVLAVARGGRDGQFDNCYLVCLSARTGHYRWSTYVGSGTRTFDGDTFFGQDPSQLALADGRVLVMTNLGTIAALDPADGRVLWLNAYKRDNAESQVEMIQRQQLGGGGGPPGNPRPWARNPVVCQGGHVFALPTDAKSLFVLDAATGRELKRIATGNLSAPESVGASQADLGPVNVLLGTHEPSTGTSTRPRAGELLIVTDKQFVYGLDWQAYQPDHPRAALRFSEMVGLDSGEGKPPVQIQGRGFLTADSILVTTQDHMDQIGWPRGRAHLVAVYPSSGTFSGGQGPGNVLVTSQNVVVAGPDRVDVYTDLGVVRAKYEAQMRAAPTDPQPRVRFATALFAGGQSADALARMDQAIDLVGGRSAMRPGPGRQLIFNVLLDFARRLTQQGTASASTSASPADGTVELAASIFDRAADAADGPDQRVAYLLARGRFARDVARDDRAGVDWCQQVLADPALRAVAVTDEQTAADAATAAIAQTLATDRAAYAPVEARAAAALADARGRSDADALLAVAEVYPNSGAAAAARQAAVDQFQAAGRPAAAIAVLRRMILAGGDPLVRAALLEQVAADFLATGPDGVGPAADRLAWAGQLASFEPHLAADLTLPGGAVLHRGDATYADAVTALRATLAAADVARLPDFRLSTRAQAAAAFAAAHGGAGPTAAQFSPFLPGAVVVPDVTAVVHPAPAFNRNDRLVTWSPAGLAVYEVGQTTPRFRVAAVTDAPIGAAWAGGRWLAWTPTRVVAVSDDGRPAWPAAVAVGDLPPLPPVAPGTGAVVEDTPAPPGDGDPLAQQQAFNGQVVIVRGGRQFILRGNRLVVAPVAPAAGPPVTLAAGEQVTAAQVAGDALLVSTSTGRLVALDAAAGTVRWQARPADRVPDAVLANAHFAVARLDDPGGAMVVVYDAATGRVVGRRRCAADNLPGQLVNLALGEEGTLALTLAAGVEVKDLYEPWAEPPTPLAAHGNADAALWTGMGRPEQLAVSAGRVVGLYDSGRYAVAYDLSRRADPTNPLPSGATSPNAFLRLVGPQLFLVQPGNVKRFNLTDPADSARDVLSAANGYHVRGLLLGSDHAIIVDDPVDRGPAASPSLTLLSVSRALVPGKPLESDVLDFITPVTPRSGITDWAGVDGGVYLLFGNHKLGLLRGGRPPA